MFLYSRQGRDRNRGATLYPGPDGIPIPSQQLARTRCSFKDHLYVPEVHPDTQMMFCEREDEGHVFKVSHAQIKDMATCIHMYMCMYMTPVSDAHYATIHSGLDTA